MSYKIEVDVLLGDDVPVLAVAEIENPSKSIGVNIKHADELVLYWGSDLTPFSSTDYNNVTSREWDYVYDVITDCIN